jgi:diguanylate cyclase (GGDEF)-like protein
MEGFVAAHDTALHSGRIDTEYRMVGADGVVRWVRDRGRIRHEDGRRFLDGSILDVTAVHEARIELEAARTHADRLAATDPLTGVANRRALPERLAGLCVRGAAVLLVDVDHFKQVNDLHGHRAGDAVLVELARRLRAGVRAGDDVVRMGGEEFLVLLPGVTEEALLLERAEAIRAGADRPVAFEGDVIPLTVSVGAALARDGIDHDALLAAADDGLYTAKRLGRNRVALGRPDRPEAEPGLEESGALRVAHAFAAALACAGVDRFRLDAVASLAAATARRRGLAHGVVVRSRLVGLLHQVGRLRTPPGAEPHEVAAAGAELLASVPELAVLAPAVRHLHDPDTPERPLEARVVSAALAELSGRSRAGSGSPRSSATSTTRPAWSRSAPA